MKDVARKSDSLPTAIPSFLFLFRLISCFADISAAFRAALKTRVSYFVSMLVSEIPKSKSGIRHSGIRPTQLAGGRSVPGDTSSDLHKKASYAFDCRENGQSVTIRSVEKYVASA